MRLPPSYIDCKRAPSSTTGKGWEKPNLTQISSWCNAIGKQARASRDYFKYTQKKKQSFSISGIIVIWKTGSVLCTALKQKTKQAIPHAGNKLTGNKQVISV